MMESLGRFTSFLRVLCAIFIFPSYIPVFVFPLTSPFSPFLSTFILKTKKDGANV